MIRGENLTDNTARLIRIRLSLTPADDDDFSGVVHATKYTVIKDEEDEEGDQPQQCLSDYDNVHRHYSGEEKEEDYAIRSNVDNGSLNKSMTSSIQHNHCPTLATDEQLNQHEQRTNDDDDDGDYIKINSQTTVLHSTMTNDDRDMNVDDDDDDDEHDTDGSHSSDELRSV